MNINKERLAAFTDAIAAIAATIMVLELAVPDGVRGADLVTRWPTFLAYINSFFMIYLVWYNHHNLFEKAKIIDQKVFLANGLWLFMLTLVPFTTGWVGEHPNDTLPELLYALVILLWTITFQILDVFILKVNKDAQPDPSNGLLSRGVIYGCLIVGCIMAFILPIATLIIQLIMVIGIVIRMFWVK